MQLMNKENIEYNPEINKTKKILYKRVDHNGYVNS